MSQSAPPLVHSVYFYDSDSSLVHRLMGIVNSALWSGNSVVLVTTQEHKKELVQHFRAQIARSPEKRTRLFIYDAEKMLETFMVAGSPDRKLFFRKVATLLDRAKEQARNSDRGLTVFGEMVAVLWHQGNKKAAIELEEIWNEALTDRGFYLHCAYPRPAFEGTEDGNALQAICDRHTHSFGIFDALT